jgi:hypothetical protein
MIFENLIVDRRNKVLIKAKLEDSNAKLNNDLEAYNRYADILKLVQHQFWKSLFGTSFITGLGAIAILMSSYIFSLWSLYKFNLIQEKKKFINF